MGVELPRELADIAAATGLSWPQADEDELREQAKAWRDAQTKLMSLAADADRSVSEAMGALSGSAAEAVGKRWSGFIDPDHGALIAAARGAGEAADRLDHAAETVGVAKVEIIRQLVSAAKNRDAAQAAAAAGHPTALLGLDTVLKGTAANLSAVTRGLADALGPDGGLLPTTSLVQAHPGAHTPSGERDLLSTVAGLPDHVPAAGSVLDRALARPLSDFTGGPVDEVGAPATDHPISHAADQTVSGIGDAATEGTESTMDTPRHLPRIPPEPAPAGTGADQLAQSHQPPMSGPSSAPSTYGGFLASGGFDEVPTPPAGIPGGSPPYFTGGTVAAGFGGGTVAAGFAEANYSTPPAAPAGFPPAGFAPAPPAAPQPGYQLPPPFPGAVGPVAGPAAPSAGSSPNVPAAGFPPAAPPVGPVPAGPAAPVRGGGFGQPAGQPAGQSAGQPPGRPAQPNPQPYPARPDLPRPEAPNPLPPLGAPRQERESIVALFLVHMFPIGHLPVASDHPHRQLPTPPHADYAPGLRFPPHDHPRAELIDSSDALEKVRAGLRRLPTPPTSPPPELTEGYEPFAGLAERDWNRRFLAGVRGSIREYAWPPGEVYPEGGTAPGEPQVLPEGTMLDRFGDITGRVFAPEGTAFAKRSLPPSALEAGYRRYRVLRELPMWCTHSVGWFGQPGGGVRYRALYSADELVTMGYLADVTFEEAA